MAFFRNPAVNLLNLHYGLHALAISGGGAFFTVYLLKAGVSVPGVLASLALILAGRFAVRPCLIYIGQRLGLRRLLVLGTVLGALQYPILAEVQGIGPALAALIALAAIADMIYWTSYHAYFAALGDNEHRGHQLGVREAVAATVGVLSPLLTGWLLASMGPRVAFGVTAALAMASALPLYRAPEVPIPKAATGTLSAAGTSVMLFACDGFLSAGYIFVWHLALFITLGQSFVAFGGALAVAAVAGAVASVVLGRTIDLGHGRHALKYAIGTLAAIVALRAVAVGNPSLAVVANAAGAIASCLYIPILMTAVYTQAKQSACTLRFHVATEAGWDIGGVCGLLTAALLVWAGVPLWVCTAIALIGVAGAHLLLNRYYGNEHLRPATAPH